MSTRQPLARPRGVTQLEFVIVVILLSLLMWVALDRLLPLRGQAEKALVLENQGVLQAALGHTVAHRVMTRGLASLPALAGSNPMELMATPPPGYQGSLPTLDTNTLPAGAWAFDQSRGVLVYRLNYPQYFTGTPNHPARTEWRIRVVYAANTEPVPDNIRAVVLETLGQPRW